MIKKAEFKSAAESRAETGEGDSECASGSQKCTGASPIFVPIPNKTNTKDNLSQKGLKVVAFANKSWYASEFIFPVAIVRRIIPTNASAIPIEQI